MELLYIQDIAGDKTETPVAPFARQKRKTLLHVPAEYIGKIS